MKTLSTTETAVSPIPISIDPALPQALAQQGSPLMALFLLIWLVKVLTKFVQTCKED